MSPLAEILHSYGYEITGSDVNDSDNVERMRSLGIAVAMPQCAENIGQAQAVVYTAAVGEDNPELAEARRRGLTVLERAELLGAVTAQYPRSVAVAGTHGKTTTSSMLSQILLMAEKHPAVFIGGRLPLIGANGCAGTGDTMVCEACEYQNHYHRLRRTVGIILNVDADHLDFFGDIEHVIDSFRTFAQGVSEYLIINADDENTCRAAEGLRVPLLRFGLNDGADFTARDVQMEKGAFARFTLVAQGQALGEVRLGVPGRHNVYNALAAAAAASVCGATAAQIIHGLKSFHGAGRRFEFLGTFGGVTVADDYAHHPTEIEATLSAARALTEGRLWAIFQPFTYTRTERHLHEFAQVLSAADEVIVSAIMGSREKDDHTVSSDQLVALIPGAHSIPDFDGITAYVAEHVKPGDLVLTMGGGDVYKCARKIVQRLTADEK